MKKPNKTPRRKQFTRGTLALYIAGSSPSEVADLEGCSPAHVTKVCKGESKSARIQKRIERITGKSWDQIMAGVELPSSRGAARAG